MLLFHTLLVRRAIAIDALPILVFSSLSRERLLEMEPRYVKSSTTSRVWSPMEMQGVLLTSWPMTFVFFRLMVSPNSEARAKLLMRRCSASSVWAVRAASSANSISLIRTLCTLVFARRRARLKRLPSLLVRMKTPSSDWLKAWRSSREKKMPKSVGARTQPCFTPLRIGKGSEDEPSYWTVPFISSWKDVTIFRSLGGHLILCNRVKRPFLLTEVEGLGQVDEGDVEWLSLLPALLLQLSQWKDHVNRWSLGS